MKLQYLGFRWCFLQATVSSCPRSLISFNNLNVYFWSMQKPHLLGGNCAGVERGEGDCSASSLRCSATPGHLRTWPRPQARVVPEGGPESWAAAVSTFIQKLPILAPPPRTMPQNSVIQLLEVHQIRSDQSLSRVQLFATPWTAACQASLSITNSRSSLTLTCIESVMPSSHLILCRPLLLLPPIPPSIRVFSNESTLPTRWPKYWRFSLSIIPSKEIPGLMSFSMDWLDLLAAQGTLKSLLQHHSSKASILRCSAFFTVQLSHPYTWPLEKSYPWLDGPLLESNVSAFQYAI